MSQIILIYIVFFLEFLKIHLENEPAQEQAVFFHLKGHFNSFAAHGILFGDAVKGQQTVGSVVIFIKTDATAL